MKHLKWRNFVPLIFFAIVFNFQNCADPLQIDEADSASAYDNYPFAYETKIDTFAYMSCSGFDTSSFNNEAIFSYKAAAVRPGSGVGLNSDFLTTVGDMLPSQQEKVLKEGLQNRGAQVQAVFRGTNNLLQYYISNTGSTGTEGVDYDNLLNPLDEDNLLRPLILSKGQKIGYFSNIEGLVNRRVESSLYFNGSEALAKDLRNLLNDGQLIYALGFVDVDGEHPVTPISPAQSASEQAYGMGLRISFTRGAGRDTLGNEALFGSKSESDPNGSYNDSIRRVIDTINEVDLMKPTITKTTADAAWECPKKLRFMIVRPEDNARDNFCGNGANVNGYYEDPNSFPKTFQNGAVISQDEYNAVRAMLPIESWHIDFQKRCIVSKDYEDKCYDTSSEDEINYYPGSTYPVNCIDEDGVRCPHYVSICYRKQ